MRSNKKNYYKSSNKMFLLRDTYINQVLFLQVGQNHWGFHTGPFCGTLHHRDIIASFYFSLESIYPFQMERLD